MRIVALVLVLVCCGCKREQQDSLPYVKPVQPTTVEEAQSVAKELNGQVCTLTESSASDAATRDVGTYNVECENGLYTFETGMSHIYADNWGVGNAYFEYRDELQMKPEYRESGEPQELNPAYYLVPLPSR